MKEAYQPELFDKRLLDEKVNVEDEPAFEMTRRLAREEGLMVGMSSGAALVVAAEIASTLEAGTLVVVFPDGGERYLSTPLFAVQEKINLQLFNTMTRKKERFLPVNPGNVSMYACGPTAHARMHVGEGRRFIFSDLLARYLAYRGYAVKQVMNITDLDDKTIEGSQRAGMSLEDFTGMHIDAFHKDLHTLGIQPADHYPRASEHADDMVNLADRLVKKGTLTKSCAPFISTSRGSRNTAGCRASISTKSASAPPWTWKNMKRTIPAILPCSSAPGCRSSNGASLPVPTGATCALPGTCNVRPCPCATWGTTMIFTAPAGSWFFPTTKMKSPLPAP
jgi:hypothetical protein